SAGTQGYAEAVAAVRQRRRRHHGNGGPAAAPSSASITGIEQYRYRIFAGRGAAAEDHRQGRQGSIASLEIERIAAAWRHKGSHLVGEDDSLQRKGVELYRNILA